MTTREKIFAGIACTRFSQAQRTALIRIALGAEDLDQFVPDLWNRRAKARRAMRELEKAGHLVRDGQRLLLLESSFAHPSEPSTQQLLLPEERLLGTALAEVSRVPGDACPSQDGQPCPSQDGHDPPARQATCSEASYLGHTRSSNRRKVLSVDSMIESVPPGTDSGGAEFHRDQALERLAKNGRLASVRAELLRRKTPTATRFWRLLEVNPYQAARIVQEIGNKRNPAAYLNRVLRNLEIPKGISLNQ